MTDPHDFYVIMWREPHTHPQHVRTYTAPEDNDRPVAARIEQIDPPLPLTHVIDDDDAFQDWNAAESEEPVIVRVDVVERLLGWEPVLLS